MNVLKLDCYVTKNVSVSALASLVAQQQKKNPSLKVLRQGSVWGDSEDSSHFVWKPPLNRLCFEGLA